MRATQIAAAAKRQPLVKTLDKLLRDKPPKTEQSKSGGGRVDIVSEKLCDDVIKYLSPTLEQHKGCTLIDFHPGPCLFSSKLHDYLKPKVHYLIEPQERYLKPFIQPLLDNPGSTYRLSNLPSTVHPALRGAYHIRTKLDPNLLADRTPYPHDDPRRHEFDPSLLVIGNLARRRRARAVRVNERIQDLARLVLHSQGNDLLSRASLFERGLIRMLWWVPEILKPGVFPSNVPSNRFSLSVGLDMAFNISEVAGVTPIKSMLDKSHDKQRKRLEVFNEMNSTAVEKRMKSAGLFIPQGRILQQSDSPGKELEGQMTSVSPFEHTASTVAALDEKISAVSSRLEDLSKWTGVFRVSSVRHEDQIRAAMDSLEYPQSKSRGLSKRDQMNEKDNVPRQVVLLDLGLRILNLEASYKDLEDRDTAKNTLERLQKKILKLDSEYHKLVQKGGSKTVAVVGELLEDQLAFYSSTPLLSWDRRSYEPLQAAPSEFYPEHEIALIDVMPKTTDLAVPDLADSHEGAQVCSQLIQTIFASRNTSVPSALDRIGVNASKDLIPMVPAISDPRKGGRLNPKGLRARMMTTEMLEGLVKAFFEWPFRPQSWELSLANSEAESVEEFDDESTKDGTSETSTD